jgi:putative peptidoglycan lipid II flippase
VADRPAGQTVPGQADGAPVPSSTSGLSGPVGPGAYVASGAASALARLLVAAVPAAGCGLFVADTTAPAGALPAGAAGGLAILAVFCLLARPLRLTEVQALLASASRRLRGLARRG